MESIFDIKAEAERDEAIERFKQRTIMTTERDVHIAFEVYGRDTVIDLVAGDCLAFLLDDRIITQHLCQSNVCKKDDVALLCMFHGESAIEYLKAEIATLIDEMIADYEVML